MGLAALLDENTLTCEQVEDIAARENVHGVILLEEQQNKLSKQTLEAFQNPDKFVCAIAHTESSVHQESQYVLPTTTYAESDGHFVNYQGRLQGYYAALAPVRPVQESWRWLKLIAQGIVLDSGQLPQCDSLKELHQQLAAIEPVWQQFIGEHGEGIAHLGSTIPREPHRASGRTAKMANQSVHEAQSTQSDDEYCFSMEGENLSSSSEMPYTWAPWLEFQPIYSSFSRKSEWRINTCPNAINDFLGCAAFIAASELPEKTS